MSIQVTTHSIYALPEPRHMFRDDGDNWFLRRLREDIKEGDPPTIIIGGKKRRGKSFLSIKICEAIVSLCHEMKFAYRDQGMPTEKHYDLRNARFDPSWQVLYSLRVIPRLLQPPPPLGRGLNYGSPIISDESSINLSVLSFNNPTVKQIAGIHDSCAIRQIPWLLNVPGSVLRVAYQFRETASYFMQMKARGVAKVYEASPSVTGRVYLKTIGWLGYQNPFTHEVVARISVPTEENVRVYNAVKDYWLGVQLKRSEQKMLELSERGFMGAYDEPEDFQKDYADVVKDIMAMAERSRNHKNVA